MGFGLDAGDASFVYSGDSGPCQALTDLAQGADLMIHMCFQLSQEARGPDWLIGSSGHLDVARTPPWRHRRGRPMPVDVARTAAEAGVKTVVLTHLRPHMDADGVHERVKLEMAEIYSGEVIISEDLMVFDL